MKSRISRALSCVWQPRFFAGASILITSWVVAGCVADSADADEASPSVRGVGELRKSQKLTLSCFGSSAPFVLTKGLPFSAVKVGNPSIFGYFLLDYATTGSVIDINAFPGLSVQAQGCNPSWLGESCGFSAFDFFGAWGTVRFNTQDLSGFSGTVREGGILGTDFLASVALTLDYVHKTAFLARPGTVCFDSTLANQGFVALSSVGFFASSSAALQPLETVVPGAAPGAQVPNVPTVPLRVGHTTAVAQLDTGFDDALVPYSINVNEAFFNAIVSATPSALIRKSTADLALTTCAGVAETVEAYTLAPSFRAELLDTSGAVAQGYSSVTLFVKRTPAVAKKCGGIGTWTTPAAQIGASFYKSLGALVFDPFTSRVWVRTR